MQYRQLPPAGELSDLEAVCRAVPTSPEETDDCCRRICDRTDVDSREHASQWLVFLTALGCVSDDGEGYYRHADIPTIDGLGEAFEASIFGVQPVLQVLETATEPLTPEEVLDRVDESTRQRMQRSETGAPYVTQVLEWAAVFDRVEKRATGYAHAATE